MLNLMMNRCRRNHFFFEKTCSYIKKYRTLTSILGYLASFLQTYRNFFNIIYTFSIFSNVSNHTTCIHVLVSNKTTTFWKCSSTMSCNKQYRYGVIISISHSCQQVGKARSFSCISYP